jgi:hypothetical protein
MSPSNRPKASWVDSRGAARHRQDGRDLDRRRVVAAGRGAGERQFSEKRGKPFRRHLEPGEPIPLGTFRHAHLAPEQRQEVGASGGVEDRLGVDRTGAVEGSQELPRFGSGAL